MVSSGHWGLHKRNWLWGFRDELRDMLSFVVSRGCHLQVPVSYDMLRELSGTRECAAAERELG